VSLFTITFLGKSVPGWLATGGRGLFTINFSREKWNWLAGHWRYEAEGGTRERRREERRKRKEDCLTENLKTPNLTGGEKMFYLTKTF